MLKVNKILDKYLESERTGIRGRKMAAANIKILLAAIDLEAEIIPENNREMLTRLLISLKGEELTEEEMIIISEITENKIL